MSERDERVEALAEVVWTTSRADEGTISATGANIIARALLDSPAMRDLLAEERARALREAADDHIVKFGVVGATTRQWLRTRADIAAAYAHRADEEAR